MTRYLEMIVAPVLALVMLCMTNVRGDLIPGLFVGGFTAWTLAEYAVHRWVLHDLAPTQHRLHHRDPQHFIPEIFWPIWLCFVPVFVLAGGPTLAGVLCAYAWYLYVHDAAHHARDRLPRALRDHHDFHHRYATRCFGVSTTVWDHVFGTKK